MNNLTQKEQKDKIEYLQKQLESTIEIYEAASLGEREAAIKHINLFIGELSDEQQKFWLKFRGRLERMNEAAAIDIDTFNTIYLGGNSSPFPQ